MKLHNEMHKSASKLKFERKCKNLKVSTRFNACLFSHIRAVPIKSEPAENRLEVVVIHVYRLWILDQISGLTLQKERVSCLIEKMPSHQRTYGI